MRKKVLTRKQLRRCVAPGRPQWRVLSLAFVIGSAMMVWGSAVPSPISAAMMRPAPKAYVGVFNDNAIAVIDTAMNRVLTTIPVPVGPHGLVLSPDGLRVYASSDGASTVSVISTVTDRLVSSIDVGKAPHGLAISRDGRQVLAAVFGTSQVVAIDTVRNQVIWRIPVGNPHNLAISPDGRMAYVAAQQRGATALVVLDLTIRRQMGAVPLDKTPRALSFSPDGNTLYFTLAGSDAVQVLDTARNQIIAQIPVGASPHHPLLNGEYGLVVSQGPGLLEVINPSTQKVIGTVTVGSQPHWIATSSNGDTAYVTNEGSNSVSVVDIGKQKVLATIPVGNAPRKIVVQPGPAMKAGAAMPATVHGPIMASRSPGGPSAQASLGPTVGGAARAIRIENFAFRPEKIKVATGTVVVWTNGDTIPHTSTSNDRHWDSKPIQPGSTFTVTFDKPGTYAYGCMIHPFMQATVTVEN
jgi:YVTN family beta-propeller protein